MKLHPLAGLALAATVLLGTASLPARAGIQTGAKQDMKNAGSETKNAATDAGHGVAKGTKKAYRGTKHGTKVAAHDTASVSKKAYHGTVNGTRKLGDKIEGK